ncbi:MAG: hypothetical protein RLZZ584_4377 [Pseudomonadota bacterium]
MDWGEHVHHVYALRTAQRAQWQAALLAQGIHTGIHYPVPVHLQPAYAGLGYRRGQFPQAERAAAEVMSLPMYAELGAARCDTVVQALARLNAVHEAARA